MVNLVSFLKMFDWSTEDEAVLSPLANVDTAAALASLIFRSVLGLAPGRGNSANNQFHQLILAPLQQLLGTKKLSDLFLVWLSALPPSVLPTLLPRYSLTGAAWTVSPLHVAGIIDLPSSAGSDAPAADPSADDVGGELPEIQTATSSAAAVTIKFSLDEHAVVTFVHNSTKVPIISN